MAKFYGTIILFLYLLSGIASTSLAGFPSGNSMHQAKTTALSPKPSAGEAPQKHKWAHKIADKIAASKLGQKVMKWGAKSFDLSSFNALGFVLGFLLGLLGVLIAYFIKDTQGEGFMTSAWIGCGCVFLLFLGISIVRLILLS